jgi:hypothetical protein
MKVVGLKTNNGRSEDQPREEYNGVRLKNKQKTPDQSSQRVNPSPGSGQAYQPRMWPGRRINDTIN